MPLGSALCVCVSVCVSDVNSEYFAFARFRGTRQDWPQVRVFVWRRIGPMCKEKSPRESKRERETRVKEKALLPALRREPDA